MFMRLGTPSGLSTTSTGRPSSRNGMSASGTILEMTPLLPWRPASLSPSAILRFLATNTRTRSFTPGERSSPAARLKVLTSITTPPSPCGTFRLVSRTSRAFSLKIARDLLVAELGRARVGLVLLDVNRSQRVVLDQTAAEDDRVREVVALPGH